VAPPASPAHTKAQTSLALALELHTAALIKVIH
jgi:hypothetical protein